MRMFPRVMRFVVTGRNGYGNYGESHTIGYARKLAVPSSCRPETQIWYRETGECLEIRGEYNDVAPELEGLEPIAKP